MKPHLDRAHRAAPISLGTPVYVPLPQLVVEALENIPPGPKPNPRYFFWSGNGDPKSVVADWQRSYRRSHCKATINPTTFLTANEDRKCEKIWTLPWTLPSHLNPRRIFLR